MTLNELKYLLTDIIEKYEDYLLLTDLSQVDGFFAALACVENKVDEDLWIEAMWIKDKGEPKWEKKHEYDEIVRHFIQYYNVIASLIGSDEYDYSMTLFEYEDKKPSLDSWCHGFMNGIHFWPDLFDEDDIMACNVLREVTPYSGDKGEELLDSTSTDELYEKIEIITENVRSLFNYFADKREKKAVGRNDPCPCGSDKKYKKCCLH